MGMYTSLRFRGIIKPQYREEIGKIEEYWDEYSDNFWKKVAEKLIFMKDFSQLPRCDFIPFGAMSAYNEDKYLSESFRNYNLETGEWDFLCDLKNYDDEIGAFIELIPHLCDEVSICERWYEEWFEPRKYELIDGKMKISKSEVWGY